MSCEKEAPVRDDSSKQWKLEFNWLPSVILNQDIDSKILLDPLTLIAYTQVMSIKHGISIFKEDIVVRAIVADDEKSASFEFFRGFKMYEVWDQCGHAASFSKLSRDINTIRFSCLMWKKKSSPEDKWHMYNFPCNHDTHHKINSLVVV